MNGGRPTGNRVLDRLPDDQLESLVPRLTPEDLPVGTVLFEPGQPIEVVHFPLGGVISLVTALLNGAVVEVATIGNEGIVGVPMVLGQPSRAVRAISQVSGSAFGMDAEAFLDEVGRQPAFADVVQRYTVALFSQISQAAGCNRLHSNEERLSRWLLMSQDRVGKDDFAITHEFLSQMLGSRPAAVTVSAGILQQAGLISYRRGRLKVLDREGLEGAACECYRVIRDELDAVVWPPHQAD